MNTQTRNLTGHTRWKNQFLGRWRDMQPENQYRQRVDVQCYQNHHYAALAAHQLGKPCSCRRQDNAYKDRRQVFCSSWTLRWVPVTTSLGSAKDEALDNRNSATPSTCLALRRDQRRTGERLSHENLGGRLCTRNSSCRPAK